MIKAMESAMAIFKAAYGAVSPHRLVRAAISIDPDHRLHVIDTGRCYSLDKNVYVVAFGKAACGMSRAVDDILHGSIVDGVVSMPHGTVNLFRQHGLKDLLPREDTVLRYHEGAVNNLPDENSHKAALAIKEMVGRLSKKDLLLVLISGGGSSLLPCPVPGISLEEKTRLKKFLSGSGANICELNTVGQHLSQLKGGRLAQLAAKNAQHVISLIISDIVGDPVEFIASGPTVQSRTTPADALDIIRKYEGISQDKETVPKSVIDYLEKAKADPVNNPDISDRVDNLIIGSNRGALEAAKAEAEKNGYQTELISCAITGEAKSIGQDHARNLENLLSKSDVTLPKRCFLWGGETTVRVKGPGRGGRNQEMVLAFALGAVRLKLVETYPKVKFAFLSAGTDGQDGPNDAAGAVIDSRNLGRVNEEEVKAMEEHLERNDSYGFFDTFRGGQCHVKCGLTGTNVMDVQVLVVECSGFDSGMFVRC